MGTKCFIFLKVSKTNHGSSKHLEVAVNSLSLTIPVRKSNILRHNVNFSMGEKSNVKEGNGLKVLGIMKLQISV